MESPSDTAASFKGWFRFILYLDSAFEEKAIGGLSGLIRENPLPLGEGQGEGKPSGSPLARR